MIDGPSPYAGEVPTTDFGGDQRPPDNPFRHSLARPVLPYAPWSTINLIERGKQLRSMSATAYMLLGPGHPLWMALRAGETDAEAFLRAHDLTEALPALTRRRLLSTFASVTWPKARGVR